MENELKAGDIVEVSMLNKHELESENWFLSEDTKVKIGDRFEVEDVECEEGLWLSLKGLKYNHPAQKFRKVEPTKEESSLQKENEELKIDLKRSRETVSLLYAENKELKEKYGNTAILQHHDECEADKANERIAELEEALRRIQNGFLYSITQLSEMNRSQFNSSKAMAAYERDKIHQLLNTK